MKDQGFDVEAVYFNLPFGCGCCNSSCNFNFTQVEEVKMKIFDATKGELLDEYLAILKDPQYGTGKGINPCKDCKVFMFRKAKEYADSIGVKVIATGEVLGQRPMSQLRSSMEIIDEALGFEILRPLSAKKLEETSWEKEGLVDRSKFFGIAGRGRKKQMELAKNYGIKYPSSGGGCFLCEKAVSNRLTSLLGGDFVNEKTLPLSMIGRHFMIKGVWFVVSRNGAEGAIIEDGEFGGGEILEGVKGKPSIYYSKKGKANLEKAKELQEAYSTGDNDKVREKFEKIKL